MDGTDHPQAGFPEQTTIPTGASQRPTVSPYKEVQVLQLGWQNDIEAGRRNFKAIEAAWKEYDYVITTVFCKPCCEPQARKDENEKDIKTSRNDGSASMTRTKRICLTCPGVRGRSYSLLLASGMELSVMMRLSLATSLSSSSLRDWCGHCDVLTILKTYDGDFGAEIPATMAEKGYFGISDWKTMETLSAGCGETHIDQGKDGEDDFLERLARDLLEHREGWTAQERADRICDWERATPGSHRRIDEREKQRLSCWCRW